MANFEGGAALASLKEWGFRTRQTEREVTVGLTSTEILATDPDRIGAVIINQDTDAGRISKNPGVTTSLGTPLDASGGIVALTPRSDGEGVGQSWYGVLGGAAPGTFTVIELRREV